MAGKKESAIPTGKEDAGNTTRKNGDAVLFLNNPRILMKSGKKLHLNPYMNDELQSMVCAINEENQTDNQKKLVEWAKSGVETVTIEFSLRVPGMERPEAEDEDVPA